MTRPSGPVVATVVALLLLMLTNLLGAPLRTGAAPLGIVSLQLATGVDVATDVIGSWSAIDRSRILLTHGADLLLPFAYSAAIVLVARRSGADGVVVPAIGAALADQLENVLMLVTILRTPTQVVVQATLVSALLKWALLGLALALLARSVLVRRRTAAAGA